MRDEELDAALAERFKAYKAEMRLSEEFKRRFVGSIRRRRAWRRIWTIGLSCSSVLAGIAIANAAKSAVARGDAESSLTADAGSTNEMPSVSCWMLLGYLRECLVRTKPARRKEDEQNRATTVYRKGAN